MNLALTNLEKEVLFRKYKQNGLCSMEANKKVEEFSNCMRTLVLNLMKKKKSEKDIQSKFKQKFEELYMKIEV